MSDNQTPVYCKILSDSSISVLTKNINDFLTSLSAVYGTFKFISALQSQSSGVFAEGDESFTILTITIFYTF